MSTRTLKVAVCMAAGLLVMGTTAMAGRYPNPIVHTDRVEAYSSNTYFIDFNGGQWAHLWVIGDRDTDLDVDIYDMQGNLVTQDLAYGDFCHVQWRPSQRRTYRVVVKNLGSTWNQFTLVTN